MEWLPGGEDQLSSSILSLTVTYPFYLADTSNSTELLRLLLLLNRMLPFGDYGLQEDKRAVDYRYQLLVAGEDSPDATLVQETVGTIAWITQAHADIIEQVLSGEVGCDEVIKAINAAVNSPVLPSEQAEPATDHQ